MITNSPDPTDVGSIMPVVALLMVCLCGFTALSVEVATIATVKTQCQNAADSAALAGSPDPQRRHHLQHIAGPGQRPGRGLGELGSAQQLWQAGGGPVRSSSEVSTTCGTYHYSTTNQSFAPA